jgi:hypothetical protein
MLCPFQFEYPTFLYVKSKMPAYQPISGCFIALMDGFGLKEPVAWMKGF